MSEFVAKAVVVVLVLLAFEWVYTRRGNGP